jgi:hypothetical protein
MNITLNSNEIVRVGIYKEETFVDLTKGCIDDLQVSIFEMHFFQIRKEGRENRVFIFKSKYEAENYDYGCFSNSIIVYKNYK